MRPHYEYCSVVRGNCNLTRSNKLEKLQNRATRILTFSTYDINVEHLFSKLGWRKLSAQREMQKAVLVFKSLNGFTPECLSEPFVNRSGTPRTKSLFHSPHHFFCWHALHAEAPLHRIRIIIIINHHYPMHLISKCFVPDLTKRVFHHLTHNSLWSYAKRINKKINMV